MAAAANTIIPKSHVGFDSITSQIEKKLLKRGFQFNVICVGMYLAETKRSSLLHDRGGLDSALTFCHSYRPDGSGQVHPHQHHLRLAPDGLQGSHGA